MISAAVTHMHMYHDLSIFFAQNNANLNSIMSFQYEQHSICHKDSVSTFTEISLSTESSPNGLAMVIPGGSFVSNIIIANVLKLFGSLSAVTVVSIPRSLKPNHQHKQ